MFLLITCINTHIYIYINTVYSHTLWCSLEWSTTCSAGCPQITKSLDRSRHSLRTAKPIKKNREFNWEIEKASMNSWFPVLFKTSSAWYVGNNWYMRSIETYRLTRWRSYSSRSEECCYLYVAGNLTLWQDMAGYKSLPRIEHITFCSWQTLSTWHDKCCLPGLTTLNNS